MLKFNNIFIEPLRGHIIESATRVVNYRQYLYKNETLMDFLELDYELCERLGLECIYKIKTREKRYEDYYKKKLKLEGKTSEKEKISQRRAKIKALLQKGLSLKEIYLSLNISKRTCINDVKFLKEQGLI